MTRPKLSKNIAQQLMRLLAGETVNASAFSNRNLLKRLEEDRVVSRMSTGRTRAVVRCADPAALRRYVRLQLGIIDLEAYLDLMDQPVRDGEESLQATTSTKALRTGSLQGFLVKAFGVEIRLDGNLVPPLPNGADCFVHRFDALSLPETATVVGVENPECFLKAERLLPLFPHRELVFVLRYYGKSTVRWLKTIPNDYLHFGDFDPAGVALYLNEFVSELDEERCRFFVPECIEALIQNGDPGLYDRQRHLLPSGDIRQPELATFIQLMHRFGRGAEQEQLLRR
jgi:hypothetical protein